MPAEFLSYSSILALMLSHTRIVIILVTSRLARRNAAHSSQRNSAMNCMARDIDVNETVLVQMLHSRNYYTIIQS